MKFFKDNLLFLALIAGSVFSKYIAILSPITPFILFLMLFLTFSRLHLKDLRFERIHFIILTFQLLASIASYYLIAPLNTTVAQGVFICLLCPTAISAAVVTVKMGGRIESITTYTMLSNITIAILIPFLFPFISENGQQIEFLPLFTQILAKVFPLLLGPFIIAQIIKYTLPRLNTRITNFSGASFYLWAIALTVVTAQTVQSLIHSPSTGHTILFLALSSLIVCIINFSLGRYLGVKAGHPIAATQSLGQKNTILAIWVSHTFLNPLTALAPGCYVLWQNFINAFQIYLHNKHNKK